VSVRGSPNGHHATTYQITDPRPGAFIATSNKRDILDATRGMREREGDMWVFDPQQVAGEQPLWWWDPLSFVVNDDTARELAQHFAFGSRAANARADTFFDGHATAGWRIRPPRRW
jgi:hypothetical protein